MGTARIVVWLQAILVISLFLLQIPFLPCTLAAGSGGNSIEPLLMMRRETHHEGHIDLFAASKPARRPKPRRGPQPSHSLLQVVYGTE
uniref:Secreted protein n=1 Tax=Leersia perrieri TaxID=77586 RepID=A0A0D9VDR6_9ORYZ